MLFGCLVSGLDGPRVPLDQVELAVIRIPVVVLAISRLKFSGRFHRCLELDLLVEIGHDYKVIAPHRKKGGHLFPKPARISLSDFKTYWTAMSFDPMTCKPATRYGR